MCGRYSLITEMDALKKRFGFANGDMPRQSRFNIAPTHEVITVTNSLTSDGSLNHALPMKWGLIPSWAKDSSIGNRMINARAETIDTRPMFCLGLESRRCLVLADGFYEWMKVGKSSIPMRAVLKSAESFAFAGLWEIWNSPEGNLVTSGTIITTKPNAVMEPVHNRMPVILPRETEGLWLDMGQSELSTLKELLVPYPADDMEVYEVSKLVNSPGNDTYDVISRVASSHLGLLMQE